MGSVKKEQLQRKLFDARQHKSEAQARAAALIWLIKNKYLTINEINKEEKK